MLSKPKITAVFGTRPDAIKMCPVVRALHQHSGKLDVKVCVTAQHREMLDQVLDIFSVVPDFDLDIMLPRQTLSQITIRALSGLEDVLEKTRPDLVLVHGDTTTAFAAGLAAFYHKIEVGHVEAGLRTRDRYDPYPEEMNRRLLGPLANIHFAPTNRNRENLINEQVEPATIFVTGNTEIDALSYTVKQEYRFHKARLNGIFAGDKRIILAEVHRRENHGEPIRNICFALRELAESDPGVLVVFPVHPNPAVSEDVNEILAGVPGVLLLDPLRPDDFHNLLARSYLIVTDSGGQQESAPALGVPVILCRKNTERPEALAAGTVRVAGTNKHNVLSAVKELLYNNEEYEKMQQAINPYGDGQASRRIAQFILHRYGLAGKPEPFTF